MGSLLCSLLNWPHFPNWLREGNGLGQSLGTRDLPQAERCWVRRGGQDGCTGKGAGLSLASSS